MPTMSEMGTQWNNLQEQQLSFSNVNSLSRREREPQIVMISINRGNGGIGLSIVAAQGIGERSVGIYVKKVVDGSAAYQDGRLESGDQLLSVNGLSLTGISQEKAASKISSSGPIVSFEVYKHAARHNGLYEWLNNPPQIQVPTSSSSGIHTIIQTGQLPPSGQQQQSIMSNTSSGNVTINATTTNPQRFSRQNSAASMTSNYSNNVHFNKPIRNVCPGTLTNSGYRIQPKHDSVTTIVQQQQCIKNRSASTSDIYENLIDKALTVSLASLQPSSGTTTVPIQCEKYQTNTTNSHRTMPSHYRNSRPIVIQPMRPTPSPTLRQQQQPYQSRSHSPHLYTNSTLSSSNQYHNSALKNAISSEYALSSASTSPVTDYANLPVIDDHHSTFESSYSSTSSRNILPYQRPFPHNSTQQLDPSRVTTTITNSILREQNSIPSTSSHDSLPSSIIATTQESGSVTEGCHGRRYMKKAPPVPPKRRITRRDKLNAQLDELESKGSAMSDADHQKYRELINELAKIPAPLPVESNLSKKTDEQKQSKSLAVKDVVNPIKQDDTCFERPKGLPVLEKCDKTSRKLEMNEVETIGKTKQQAQNFFAVEEEEVADKKDFLLSNGDLDETVTRRKGVKWGGKVAENDEKRDSFDSDSKLVDDEDDQPEPRTQVLGTNEVYRDPRQLRLIELEAKQHAAKEAKIDGSKLGFRDKMQLFAEQIGEKALKNRHKASTIQREIEQTMDDI